MQKENQQDFINLVEFWNQAYQFEDKEEDNSEVNLDEEILKIAPSEKLFSAAKALGDRDLVLDYGCGSGWASVIAAYSGSINVDSVDVISNGCKVADYYAKAFKVKEKIHIKQIGENWLSEQKEISYDGIFCSNVVDVVPLEMAESIVKELGRLLKNDGLAIISLNYFMDCNVAKDRGFDVKEKQIYINGVLRLLSMTDEEWEVLLNKYFEIEKLDYFSWPGEKSETRRLFFLRKKQNV